MHKSLLALLLASMAATPALASEKTDVMAALHQLEDAFNKGDSQAIMASCTEVTSIIDDLPPHEWHGAGACAKWWSDFEAFSKAKQIGAESVTLGKPRHLDITADRAYVVVPATDTFTMGGKPMKLSGSLMTIVLHKGSSGWRVSAWAWSDGVETEVKPVTNN